MQSGRLITSALAAWLIGLCLAAAVVPGAASDIAPPAQTYYDTAEDHRKSGEYDIALALYKVAAKKGHTKAHHWAGALTYTGRGTPADTRTALPYLQLAAQQGVRGSSIYLAEIYLTDPDWLDCDEGERWVRTFATSKDTFDAWMQRIEACRAG